MNDARVNSDDDEEAWSTLCDQHYDAVLKQVRYLCGEHAMAEEITQETFAVAHANRHRYDSSRSFQAWCNGIAFNVIREHWRKRRNRGVALEHYRHQRAARGGPEDPLLQVPRDRCRKMNQLLQELPPRWREAFVIRELQGVPVDEAAQQLATSRANVAVRVARARKRLKEEFVERGWKESGLGSSCG